MRTHRIAVAGAGNMARARGRAFVDTGRAEICAVAARRMETAAACAAELACDQATGDYRCLADAEPDAILIETPHAVQDEIALWALERDIDLLIGGCLASNLESGARIIELAAARDLVVEAGAVFFDVLYFYQHFRFALFCLECLAHAVGDGALVQSLIGLYSHLYLIAHPHE